MLFALSWEFSGERDSRGRKAKTDASLSYDLFSALADIDSIFKTSLQEKSNMIIYSCDIKYQISYWVFSHLPNHSNFSVHTHDSFYPIFLGSHSD